jgi:hypothetical protein
MRVLQGHCLGAVQDAPQAAPNAQRHDFFESDSPSVKTFSCDPSGALPFDGDSFSGGKARSVSAMGQPVNAIRRKETPRMGTVVMEHLTHQQNLAHCRRLLAEAALATSSDEIRHSMLMRLLAEEEAHGLAMPVTAMVLPSRRAE